MISTNSVTVSIFLVFFVILYQQRGKAIVDAPFLIAVVLLLTGVIFPVAASFVEVRTWRDISGYEMSVGVDLQTNYLCALLGILYAEFLFSFLKKAPVGNKSGHPFTSGSASLSTSLVLLLTGATLYGIYLSKVGLAVLTESSSLTEKYQESGGLALFYFGLNIMILGCLAAEKRGVPTSFKLFARFIAIGICYWSVFEILVRTYFAIIFLGYIYIFVQRRKVLVGQFKMRYAILGLSFWVILEFFVVIRGLRSNISEQSLTQLTSDLAPSSKELLAGMVGGSDFAHPFISFYEVHQNEEAGSFAGTSYVDGLLSLVPKVVNPERPQTIAQWFVGKYYPGISDDGGGTAFSTVAEAWLNFGAYWGPFLIGLILVCSIRLIQIIRFNLDYRGVSAFGAYATFVWLVLERAGTIATFKHLLMIGIVYLIARFTTRFLKLSTTKQQR